jgi:hypothetical protein
MSADPHRPTTAAPSPTVTAGEATTAHPAGSVAASSSDQGGELPFGIPPDRPEILVGAAFAGGVVAAFILKRLGGN